ncbi:Bug family tripartite tricarboxylate transporter substrate binding protein [Humitalea sp. 24SJ18S-53]|uniref:Bug family tripartite tricarboxylate transporter substrate binding protein n=1 Tax=Humitalea sp. 24SJ18S-53 TaxID=3422307 RepID=UPI003D673DFA
MSLARRAFPLLALLPGIAAAQDTTVRVIVPYAPGGAIDAIGRLFAGRMGALLNETWVVENRSGGNGRIGAEAVARAAGDGRTLMFSADIHLVARQVMRDVPYDSIADFAPVARVAQGPLVLVGGPKVRAETLPALIAAMREAPQSFEFANSALGAMGHLATESFKARIGTPSVETVTYRGTAPALNDVLGGNVALMMAPLLSVLQHVQTGRLRAFGITAATRSSVAPTIPTLIEAGLPDFVFIVWYGFWGPRALPETVVARLNATAQRIAAEPDVARRLLDFGTEPVAESPGDFIAHIALEFARSSGIIRAANIQPE